MAIQPSRVKSLENYMGRINKEFFKELIVMWGIQNLVVTLKYELVTKTYLSGNRAKEFSHEATLQYTNPHKVEIKVSEQEHIHGEEVDYWGLIHVHMIPQDGVTLQHEITSYTNQRPRCEVVVTEAVYFLDDNRDAWQF